MDIVIAFKPNWRSNMHTHRGISATVIILPQYPGGPVLGPLSKDEKHRRLEWWKKKLTKPLRRSLKRGR